MSNRARVAQIARKKIASQKKCSEGKPYLVALVATMNKLTHVIHSVWTNHQPFEDRTDNQKEG